MLQAKHADRMEQNILLTEWRRIFSDRTWWNGQRYFLKIPKCSSEN